MVAVTGRRVPMVVVCAFSLLISFLISSRPAASAERPMAELAVDDRLNPRVCGAVDGIMPATVIVDGPLDIYVQQMLSRSEAFRRQCDALAAQPQVYVRVQLALYGLPPSLYARTDVQRTVAGPLIATVRIQSGVNWSEWIGHEFEHILEQVEGIRAKDFRDNNGGRWESSVEMYESSRAILAGRTIRIQMRQGSKALPAND